MSKELTKAVTMARRIETRQDWVDDTMAKLLNACRVWDDTIEALLDQVQAIAEMRDSNACVKTLREELANAEQSLSEGKGELFAIAHDLIDAKAFFPSKKKSQPLTDRVTLKSQMPSLPIIIDGIVLIEALVDTGRLEEFVKSINIKLDIEMAEPIKRWADGLAGGGMDVGLEAPQPKILNIKIKDKEETE